MNAAASSELSGLYRLIYRPARRFLQGLPQLASSLWLAQSHLRAARAGSVGLYLASEQMSGYVTSQMIEVNGGQYMP